MKCTILQDQGTSVVREDGVIYSDTIFGVLDGSSAPYSPQNPPRKFFGRLTGGEMVVRLTEGYFMNAFKSWYDSQRIKNISHTPFMFCTELRHVSDILAQFQQDAGLSMRDAGELAGATFAIANIGDINIEIAQGGDSFALWEFRDGLVGITRNQNKKQSAELYNITKELRREVAWEMFGITPKEATKEQREKIRDEVWDRYYSVLKDARRRDANNSQSPGCYAFLNGQPEIHEVMQKFSFPQKILKTLILFTDGAVPWEVMENSTDDEIASEVLGRYKKGGLPYLLAYARSIEKEIEAENHIDAAEFTAIALEF